MLKTLLISFRLKNTYRVNSILHAFRQIPLIKKLFPPTVYSMSGFKTFACVLSIIWEIISIFMFKLVYFLYGLIIWRSTLEIPTAKQPLFFFQIMIPLTIIGTVTNNFMFSADKYKYYAMMQLGMEAKQFTLTHYFYCLTKHIIGFTVCSLLVGISCGLEVWECLLFTLFMASAKTIFCSIQISRFKHGKMINNKKTASPLTLAIWIILLCIFIPALYILSIFEIMLPRQAAWAIMGTAIIIVLLALPTILRFNDYRALNKEIFNVEMVSQMDGKAVQRNRQNINHKHISSDTGISSEKNGFEYLNELFIKRHKKILWNTSIIMTVIIAMLVIGMNIGCLMTTSIHGSINSMLKKSLPYFVFIMYAANRGMPFTQALFVNCDHSLLTYSFYKQPNSLLTLFRIRLKEIIKVNLLPAAVGGLGLSFLLYTSGGTDEPITYPVIFVSICALSIFFSVHYLTLYYLLQPYNSGTEVKNGTYKLISFVTYFVCYIMIYIELPTLAFGIVTTLFCVLYCILACLLVYRFAPKTFKIHT